MELVGVDETIIFFLHKDVFPLKIEDITGKTPIFYARNPKIVHIFEDYGANGSQADYSGKPLLPHFLKENTSNAKTLMASKIYTNGKDIDDSDLIIIYDLEMFQHKKKVCMFIRFSSILITFF